MQVDTAAALAGALWRPVPVSAAQRALLLLNDRPVNGYFFTHIRRLYSMCRLL